LDQTHHKNDDPQWATLLSNETQITDDTPPTFLWHTVDDQEVPVENSLLFAEGLRRHQVPFDLHLFESGQHRLGLAEAHQEASVWPTLCETWLARRQFLKK
jgi:dipeptidyl aminopeptidase/acylaminoacyl peptidase